VPALFITIPDPTMRYRPRPIPCLLLSLAVPVYASDLPADTPVLERDGAVLTLGDIDAYVAEAPPGLRAGLFGSAERSEQILRQLMAVKNLALEAERAGLLRDPLIEQREQLLLARFRAQLRTEQLEREAAIDAEALARERYLANPDQFRSPETVTVRHLLVGTQERSDQRARELADQYLARVNAGESLADLATQFSDDPGTKERGGELPAAMRGEFDAAFSEAAFGLTEPGQIAGPVKSGFGYHIIELIKRQAEGPRPFDDVKTEVIDQIIAEHRQRVSKNHIDQLNGKPITINEDVAPLLGQRYADKYRDDIRAPLEVKDSQDTGNEVRETRDQQTP
jgi:peptidyl-prolyl cis-trans isomerase C